MKYLQVLISAENKDQADKILDALLDKKLIVGGPIINAPARFIWKGDIVNMNYFNISTYTTEKHKEAIISVVKQVSIEEVPMVSFTAFDGNEELLKWINETIG